MKRGYIILAFRVLLILFLPFGLNANVQKGILDLRNSSFSEKGIYSLNGEWEFYWNQLLEPEQFSGNDLPSSVFFGKVPSYWTEYSPKGEKLPGKGYGTYRIRILLPDMQGKNLTLEVPVFDSSFKLFINGKTSGQNGKVGTDPESSVPEYAPFLIDILPVKDTVEIMVQVSNFQHRRGGFWKQMKIGLSQPIIKEHSRYVFISYSSMGILFAFSLFFFFFFFFYKKDPVPLLFSAFLAGVFIRLICTGIFPINLMADISWDWQIRLEYLGMYIAGIAGMWFMQDLYPLKFIKPIHIFNSIVIGIFCLIIVFTSVDLFSYTMIYYQFLIIVLLLFYLVVGLLTVFKRGLGNLIYFIGTLILFIALVNDVILANSRSAISKDYMMHFAAQVFVFIHAIMLIRIWIKAFIEKERLVKEVEYLNTNLENLITQRTVELSEKNSEVVLQSEKIGLQNDLLKGEIEFKNRVFSIIAHDLKSPVASLLLFFDVIKKDISESAKETALNSIHNLTISINNLIDNL